MTLETEISRVVYTALAAQTAFPFGYKFLDDADLLVYVDDELQTITTDYTVSGAGLDEGGTVTFTTGRTAGEIIAIVRAPAITQAVDYVENDPFPAETHEGALDKLTMICQALDDGLSRAVKLSVGSSLSNITLPEPEAATTLVWNTDETALENGPSTSEIANAQTYANNASAAVDAAETAQGLAEDARDAAISAAASVPTFGAFGLTLAATTTASNARSDLELGTAARADTGTGAGDVVQLNGSGQLPAVSGALLTGLVASQISGLPDASASLPAGAVIFHAASTVPAGYLECNGAAVSRTATRTCSQPSARARLRR